MPFLANRAGVFPHRRAGKIARRQNKLSFKNKKFPFKENKIVQTIQNWELFHIFALLNISKYPSMKKFMVFIFISISIGYLYSCSDNDNITGNENSQDTYDVSVNHVVINQFYGGTNNKGTASHCFAELYNCTEKDQSLNGWSLWYKGAKSDTLNTNGWKHLLLKGIIPAHSSFLIRGNEYACNKKAHNVLITDPDQEWNIYFNTKGMTLLLKSDTTSIGEDSTVFNNTTHKPVISNYVDMLAIHGNDQTAEDIVSQFEGNATYSQSSKRSIRRQYFQDTDLNEADTENGDCVTIDYSSTDSAFIAWARPRNSTQGAWYSSDMPEYKESTQLYDDSINVLTTSITTSPYSSHSFTWQMPLEASDGTVTISKSPSMTSQLTITAERTINAKKSAAVFRAATTLLDPGTTYYYKITSGKAYSPLYSFTTGSEGSSFTFLHTSDTQSSTEKGYITYANALSMVMETYKPQFVIQTGDEVETNYFEDEWRWLINKNKTTMAQIPYFPTVGNHEQTIIYPATAFREHFSVPSNTCTDSNVTPGTAYSFDWGKVHFVVLNTQDKTTLQTQAEWLRNDLNNYKNGNIIVCMHRGVYDISGIVTDISSTFASIFEEYNVSLVLYGHDHCYMRSVQNNSCKTIHLQTGSSGIKQTAPGVKLPSYTDIIATPELPTFSVITVNSSEIKVHTVTVNDTEGITPLEGNSSVLKSTESMNVDFSIPLK